MEHIFQTVACTPALVPFGYSLARNNLHGPFAVTLAGGDWVEAVVVHCSGGELSGRPMRPALQRSRFPLRPPDLQIFWHDLRLLLGERCR